MVNQDGIMAFNELGISFVSDDIPKKKAEKVYEKMDEVIEKYKNLARKEFNSFLDSQGLEDVMGVVIKKNA